MARIDYPWNMKPLLGGVFIRELIGRNEDDYMTRIHLTPWRWWPFRNRLYLHLWRTPDNDPVPHDHPFGFRSFVLLGGYTERVYPYEVTATGVKAPMRDAGIIDIRRRWLTTHKVPMTHCHRVVKLHGRTITLVIRGPKEQDWGFFVHTFEKGVVKVPWWQYIGLPAPDRSAY